MSTLSRSLLAFPVATVFLLLYAATSRDEPPPYDTVTSIQAEIALDSFGDAPGELVVDLSGLVFPEGQLEGWHDVRVLVIGDVRRSLEVREARVDGWSARVDEGIYFYESLAHCEVDVPCEVVFPLVFSGRKERTDLVEFEVELPSEWLDQMPGLQATVRWVPFGR